MSSNSGGGTDHGWSGINMMLGGSVDGGKIIGEYPKDLRVDNELDIGKPLDPNRKHQSFNVMQLY